MNKIHSHCGQKPIYLRPRAGLLVNGYLWCNSILVLNEVNCNKVIRRKARRASMSCCLSDAVKEHIIHLTHVSLTTSELHGDAFYLRLTYILTLAVIGSELMSYSDSGRETSIVTHTRAAWIVCKLHITVSKMTKNVSPKSSPSTTPFMVFNVTCEIVYMTLWNRHLV